METCRLAVTATFAKGIPNFPTDPMMPCYPGEVAIYHAQPHGNRTPMGESMIPTIAINIDSVVSRKLQMLECHQSQQQWLQTTQKMNSYLQTMLDLGTEVSRLVGGHGQVAEGWRQHLHLGFGSEHFNPLVDALKDYVKPTQASKFKN